MHVKVRNFIAIESAYLNGANGTLRALSPQGTLERGFSIVRDSNNVIVKSVTSVSAGDELRIKLADGDLTTRVEGS
jgi:exodeoxyribonuclease VII large subunit